MACEILTTFCKDDSEVLDYKVDWDLFLSSETVASSTWTVPSGITKDSDSFDATSATIWLSGGTLTETYTLTNTITTTSTPVRTATRSFVITMGDR